MKKKLDNINLSSSQKITLTQQMEIKGGNSDAPGSVNNTPPPLVP